MSKAIDDLRNEHMAILSALQTLDAITARLDRKQPVDPRDIRDFIGFLKEFADKCHHGKEEGILFPALVKAGIPEQGGPVGVMLAEHTKGRDLIIQMEASLSGTPDYEAFSETAAQYAELLTAHIGKENNVLFPSAERVLQPKQLEQMYDAFEKHEEEVIGAGRHEQLHALLGRLKKKYQA